MMKTADVRIDPKLNQFIWNQGIRNLPRRVRVRISRKRSEEEGSNEWYSLVQHVNVESFAERLTEKAKVSAWLSLLFKILQLIFFLFNYQNLQISNKFYFLNWIFIVKCSFYWSSNSKKMISTRNIEQSYLNHNLLPFLPHLLLVVSVGIGVTSSILPILIPFLAIALRADWAPGPGALSPVPPLALSLIWTAVMLSCLSLFTTSTAAIMAAYGDDSSLSDLTFIPPVTLANVYLPVRSVTWMKVSFQVARMWQIAKTSPEVFWGPKVCPCLAYS